MQNHAFHFIKTAIRWGSLILLLAALSLSGATPTRAAIAVVGTGTPESCTDAAWQAAVAAGGEVTFDCGPGTVTIAVSTAVVDKAVEVDGGRDIILDAGGTLQHFLVLETGDLTLRRIELYNGNFANGGAIYNTGKVTMSRSTIYQSQADGGSGGAIYNTGTLVVRDSNLTNNSATNSGGGIYNDSGDVTVVDSELNNNTAQNGGGLGNNGGETTVRNSLLVGNGFGSAVQGGGIYNQAGTVDLTNVTLAGNFAQSGGHVYSSGTTNILNSTFSIGRANNGGAIFLGGGATHLKNTILSISQSLDATYLSTLCDGFPPVSDGYNLSFNETGITNCYLTNTGDQDNVDPLLSPLQDNSGPTLTLLPLTGSPAIDTGTNTGCPATDARGVARPQGAACDLGAIEVRSGLEYEYQFYFPLVFDEFDESSGGE